MYGGYFSDLTLYQNLKAIAEIVINDKSREESRINELISRFELENLRNIKIFIRWSKKIGYSAILNYDPNVLLLDECFAALDVLIIKMLRNYCKFTEKKITICICDHQARDLLAYVDVGMILSNCKIIAEVTSDL